MNVRLAVGDFVARAIRRARQPSALNDHDLRCWCCRVFLACRLSGTCHLCLLPARTGAGEPTHCATGSRLWLERASVFGFDCSCAFVVRRWRRLHCRGILGRIPHRHHDHPLLYASNACGSSIVSLSKGSPANTSMINSLQRFGRRSLHFGWMLKHRCCSLTLGLPGQTPSVEAWLRP